MTEEEAIEIARKYADQQGWTWLEPVECRRRCRWFRNVVYKIRTNAEGLGVNIEMMIGAVDGTIIRAVSLKR